jgi:hypothetical protein
MRLLLLVAFLLAPAIGRADSVWRGRILYQGVNGVNVDVPHFRLRFALNLPDTDGVNRLRFRCHGRGCRLGREGVVESITIEPRPFPFGGERVTTLTVTFDRGVVCKLFDDATSLATDDMPVRTRAHGFFSCPQKMGDYRMRRVH